MNQDLAFPMRHWRSGILAGVMLASLAGVMALEPIAQNPAYHDFADQRRLLGVPNLMDVASNIAFLVVGAMGIALCAGPRRPQQVASWSVFLHRQPSSPPRIGLVSPGAGRCRAGLGPLPMTLGFTGLFAALVAEHAGAALERRLLVSAMAVGVASVLWWHWSADLRFYLWVQFAPLLGILLLLALFPAPHTHRGFIFYALGLYGLAKVAEVADKAIFTLTHEVVSGHTLKHLIAAGAILALLVMLQRRGRST
jgi:hypothetical protein